MNIEYLNESRRHHLLTSADELLSEIEVDFTAAPSRSPFLKYSPNLTPAEGKMVRDYIAHIRAQVPRVLEAVAENPVAIRFAR